MTTKPNQVSVTIGEENINLLDDAFEIYGCVSRSDLAKKIILDWIFSNKPLVLLLKKNGN